MTDGKKTDKGKSRGALTPPAAFPDITTCHVRRSKLDDYVDCLNPWAWRCAYALHVENGYLCRHPKNFELLARMEAAQRE